MHKKFLRASSKLLGVAMMWMVSSTPTTAMDQEYDTRLPGRVCTAAKYHAGMKEKAKQATQDTVKFMSLMPVEHVLKFGSRPGKIKGNIVCSQCEVFILEDAVNNHTYSEFWDIAMRRVCSAPYGESSNYSWTWKSS